MPNTELEQQLKSAISLYNTDSDNPEYLRGQVELARYLLADENWTPSNMRPCPNHEGEFDCTPFCDVCEGNQEYEYTETRPCCECDTPVDHDTWFEELRLCLPCSDKYWKHEDEEETNA